MNDVLFNTIERMQIKSGRAFGKFLDAGTGVHSLRWIASLLDDIDNDSSPLLLDSPIRIQQSVSRYTAVTADETMRKNVFNEAVKLGIQERGSVVIGNWATDATFDKALEAKEIVEATNYLCQDEKYDTILADYLVGAMDGFSPYYQDQIFNRLAKHMNPMGRLYIVGLQPIPDKVEGDANIFCKVTKLRDACILLANHRCYREYPIDWIERHLIRSGFRVVDTSKHTILYSFETIKRQLNVARSKLPLFHSKGLADEMEKQIDTLEKEAREATTRAPSGRLRLGFDYIVAAEYIGE